MPGIDECLIEVMRLPGARGAAVVDWTSGLALGTIGESPNGDHEATAAETAEVARMAAEQPVFAQADAPGGSFSLLSYNVAGLSAEISQEHPDVNIPLISPHLADYDVVITQEDFDWWPEGGLASGLDFTNYHDRLRADATQQYATERHPGPEAVGLDTASRPAPRSPAAAAAASASRGGRRPTSRAGVACGSRRAGRGLTRRGRRGASRREG